MKHRTTFALTLTAVFMAILLLQSFVPDIGYIRIFPTLPAITTVPLTIAVYGSLMGPKAGTQFGVFWGLTRLVLAYTQPGDIVSLLLFRNLFISLVPSIVAGLLAGLIAKKLTVGPFRHEKLRYVVAGVLTSLANTLLVIGLTALVFNGHPETIAKYLGNTGMPLLWLLVSALAVNGLLEAVFTGLMTPVIVTPLQYVVRKGQRG
ncbi:MAG: ECF transporter S component [Lactobacillus sp.]